jgi:Flp pilus assembly protein CpaB
VFRLSRPRSPVHALRRVLAALLVAGALVLALRPPPAADTGPPTAPVVVAAADLTTGTTLTAGDLRVSLLPRDTAPGGRAEDPRTLVGRRLAAAVRIGEPVTDVRLVGPGLTSGLPAGQVAAPVRLADLAVTALVRAGDRVDVLATAPDAVTAEVVAADVLVLAAPGPVEDDAASARDDAGLLVLAVDDGTAARLAAVATTATLTVSLPPP